MVGSSAMHRGHTPDRATRRAGSRRTAWVLLSIVFVFFFGIMLKYWLLG